MLVVGGFSGSTNHADAFCFHFGASSLGSLSLSLSLSHSIRRLLWGVWCGQIRGSGASWRCRSALQAGVDIGLP
jgi:hypothetical protein